MDVLQALKAEIEKSSKIVFFGGAGVSTASGIPDFRSADGAREWDGLSPEIIARRAGFSPENDDLEDEA